MPRE
jgi:hypothetical protein